MNEKRITEAQHLALSGQDDLTLARWYLELNSWRWPDCLPDPEPSPTVANGYDSNGVRAQIMDLIEARVGERFILRLHNPDMPDDVFESFMRKETAFDSLYRRWVRAKVDERMARIREKEDRVLSAEVLLEGDDILNEEFVE